MKLWFIFSSIIVFLDLYSTIPFNTSSSETTLVKYQTRPSQVVNIHIMVHFDSVITMKLVKQHRSRNRKKLKDMSRKLLKEVENFFQQQSLKQALRFKLIDTKFLRNKTNVVAMDENASKYLKGYCDWQHAQKVKRRKWYYSVLLTGLDLFYLNGSGGKVRSSTGRSYMGGMCSARRSCALVEVHPDNTGFLLAHELAHSLGINHDGPPTNRCSGDHVMAAKYNPWKHPKTWSACSKFYLNRYLQSGKSWCLRADDEKQTSLG